MNKKGKIIAILIIAICVISVLIFPKKNSEIKTVKSEDELLKLYNGEIGKITNETLTGIMTMPFSFVVQSMHVFNQGTVGSSPVVRTINDTRDDIFANITDGDSILENAKTTASSSKDYSTTNIQVENVDEADITKTDGNYIYSISDNNVIITNVENPEQIKIETILSSNYNCVPEDLLLYNDKLVIIYTKFEGSKTYYSNSNTVVKIYDVSKKETPRLLKNYELYEPYYTTRCINNELFVISSGNLRKENDRIVREYKENNKEQKIELSNIKYLKDVETRMQTLISVTNLDNIQENVNVSSYLIDISNAYVSENSIYLLDQKYEFSEKNPTIAQLFGLKGVLGLFTYDYDYTAGYNTEIYKFNISNNGNVTYDTKKKISGKTINQYSLDEKDGHLRIALYDGDGARVAIFDDRLKQIGISDYVAKGETMYSSRFMGDKAYLVTYKTVDPLFVIDLSDETKPKVLGELSIPGYSTYLHPYDENHLIGIGMETKEVVNRNSSGRVISTTSRIVGMKMALFDVTDVNNPIQISETVIGDSRTTSAILTNPKALLFSKQKNLIAIPVNNYQEDFEISDSSDTYSSIISSYTNYYNSYVAEGYFVYNINLEEGFKLKGTITHEDSSSKNKTNYLGTKTKLLRGMYIENNLFTVSESAIKVNNLDNLELINELKIK